MASVAMGMPPGLGISASVETVETATTTEEIGNDEAKMLKLLEEADAEGALAVLASSKEVNGRMINMGFSAKVSTGVGTDAAAVSMLHACEAAGITPTVSFHNNVLAQLSKRSSPELVLSWLARMRESSLTPDLVACNIQLKAFAAMGNLTAAVDLLATMMAPGGPPTPDAISFNTVISALANKPGYAERAEKLLTTMLDSGFDTDLRSFTGVIVAFARASRPYPASKWLERMLQKGVQPDTATFNAVLLAYANAGDCDSAFRVLGLIEEYVQDECPNARPDVVSFNTLISACAKAVKPKRAEEAFFRMEKMNLVPTHVTFSAVINAHARAGQPAQALGWLDAMLARGQLADALSFNSVCAAYAKVGDAKSAMAVFERMSAHPGVEASPTTRAILVNALVQAGRGDDAEAMLHALVESREPLDASSFNPLLNLHAKAGQPGRALAILQLMLRAHVRPSLITFNSLAAAYASAGDMAATEDALHQAKEQGFVLDRYSYGALLQVAAKSANKAGGRQAAREAALKYTEAMLRSGIDINDYLCGAATRAVGEAAFAELRSKHRDKYDGKRGRSGEDSKWVQARGGTASGGRAEAVVVGAPAVANAVETGAVAPAAADDEGDDGWTTVASTRSRRPQHVPQQRGGSARERRASKERPTLAKSPIKKERAPPPKQPTGAAAESRGEDSLATFDVRLVSLGVPLTRSKSERARLLAVAQGVMGSDAAASSNSGPLPVTGVPPNVPLRRSQVSELALMVADDGMMSL